MMKLATWKQLAGFGKQDGTKTVQIDFQTLSTYGTDAHYPIKEPGKYTLDCSNPEDSMYVNEGAMSDSPSYDSKPAPSSASAVVK